MTELINRSLTRKKELRGFTAVLVGMQIAHGLISLKLDCYSKICSAKLIFGVLHTFLPVCSVSDFEEMVLRLVLTFDSSIPSKKVGLWLCLKWLFASSCTTSKCDSSLLTAGTPQPSKIKFTHNALPQALYQPKAGLQKWCVMAASYQWSQRHAHLVMIKMTDHMIKMTAPEPCKALLQWLFMAQCLVLFPLTFVRG